MFADYYVELYVRKTIDFLIKFTSGFQEGEKVERLKWTRLLTR
jgi:hypothetical protein